MNKYKVCYVFLICLVFLGCRKNESASGGKASINGFVELTGTVNGVYVNGARISRNTVVYIKYDATSFPGSDVSQYDSQQNVDSKGNFNFQLMFKGSYYLYAIGDYFDANGYYYQVAGGTQVNINTRKATLNYDIGVAVVKP
jgi:hypothetical protein